MAEENKVLELDKKDFALNDYDNLSIEMPSRPEMSEEDVDAQLFEYVVSGGKHINSIADLDDDWVKENFEGLETIDDVRQAIKDQYDKEVEYEERDIKFHACCDALIDRLEGEIPEDVLQSNVQAMLAGNAERLDMMHISMEQYLREEGLTTEQYEAKVREETIYQLKLNMALDLLAEVLCMQVGNNEITDYLQAPNPQKFIEEIRANGQVEAARQAAVRVKAMRRAVETAIVNGVYPGQEPDEDTRPKGNQQMPPIRGIVDDDDEDIEVPDFDNLPAPEIHDANPFRLTIIDEE